MNLDSPPFIEHLLFENPWPAVIALAIVGIALIMTGNRRRQRQPMIAGAAAIVAAVAVYFTAQAVTTDREVLVDRTRELVHAATTGSHAELDAMLDASASVTDASGATCMDRAGILARIKTLQQRVGAQHFKTVEAETRQPGFGRTYFVLRTSAKQTNNHLITHWLISWTRTPQGEWRMAQAQWLRYFNDDFRCGRF